MEYYPFPARLRSADGRVEEFGRASLAAAGHSVDFIADFVPLLPLGAPAVIEWIQGDRVLASFSGQVYLSSKNLLRLVEVDADLWQQAHLIFATNTRLPATAAPWGKKDGGFAAEICYLSTKAITLATAEAFEAGTRLALCCEVDFLTLCDLELQVNQCVVLRRGETLLLCGVRQASSENLIALSAYCARLQQL